MVYGFVMGAITCCEVFLDFTVVRFRMCWLGCLCLGVVLIAPCSIVVPVVGEGGVSRVYVVGIMCSCVLHVER